MSSIPQQTQPSQIPSSRGNNRRGRGRRSGNGRANQSQEQRTNAAAATSSDKHEQPTQSQSTRARKFGGQLSTPSTTGPFNNVPNRQPKQFENREAAPHTRSEGVNIPDLTAKLMDTLKAPPYAECVICFGPIIPQQPTWACTVSEETNRCCWGVFHNKCIVAWSKKSTCSNSEAEHPLDVVTKKACKKQRQLSRREMRIAMENGDVQVAKPYVRRHQGSISMHYLFKEVHITDLL